MLQPVYTMHGFNWFDRRGTEGIGFVRALRTLLTNNLPKILPDLETINRGRFEELRKGHPVIAGQHLNTYLIVKILGFIFSHVIHCLISRIRCSYSDVPVLQARYTRQSIP